MLFIDITNVVINVSFFFFFNDTATTEIYTLFPTRRSSDLRDRAGPPAGPCHPGWRPRVARPARAGHPSRPGSSRLAPADRAGPARLVLPDRRGGGGQLERGLSAGQPRCPARLRGRRIRRFLPGHGHRPD